jgi:hypothetical protein
MHMFVLGDYIDKLARTVSELRLFEHTIVVENGMAFLSSCPKPPTYSAAVTHNSRIGRYVCARARSFTRKKIGQKMTLQRTYFCYTFLL